MNSILKKVSSVVCTMAVCGTLGTPADMSASAADISESVSGQRSYSSRYTKITTLNSYGERGTDGWRNGLVTGNGENGVIDSAAPAEDVMIFQNMKFGYPTNAIRVTPDMSSVREETIQNIIEYEGEYLSQQGSVEASDAMLDAASEWVSEMGLANSWSLQNTYAFHPGHQLRLKMDGAENGEETAYERYTDYQTAEIGAVWTDKNGDEWERKTFASREDNVNITSMKSTSGAKVNMTITVDDIAKMSNEGGVGTVLADIRYRKVADENGDYIGWAAHYPYYHNSEFNNAGLAGITRVIVKGDGASKEYVFGTEKASDYANPVGGATETVINLGYDKEPAIKITNAEEVVLITKTERDLDMGTLGAFEVQDNTTAEVRNGTAYDVVNGLISDTAAAADKYSSADDYSDFDYDTALAPSAEKHSEIFDRLSYDVCVTEEDKAMRAYTNEEIIAAQQASKDRLLPAMLERLYYNGRFANICSSGIQAPRLGGMWTGAWGCEWSGDYTTDANINLQIAGANIGSVPEETVGFINVMLKNITDWQLNAKQVYGIDDAIMAPTRTDGYSAVVTHFASNFPGQMWLSGASWLILPMYEYYQCYGNQNIPLTPDIREELEFTGNRYAGYTEIIDKNGTEGEYHDYNIKDSEGNTVVYNMRNTLMLSDERAEEILEQGYFDLERDILYPLLTKTANFWLGFVDARYYVKDGKAYYDEAHTELGEGESYLLAPSYSPENAPANTGTCFTANAVMDISSTKSAMDMAIALETKLGGADAQENIQKYTYLAEHLPEYLYESSGELKEWALSDYEENYGHRHGSQLYGLWPSYEGETDTELFEGAKKLIETKNSVPTGDGKSGHGWLHRGLVMARLKDGEGVRDTLLPLTVWNMIYDSMMMSHNNDRTAAYCTDPVITIPAIELETLVYSDENTIELLPAMLPELEQGGNIGGTEGIHTRNGGSVKSLEWNENGVKAVISGSEGAKLKLTKAYDSVKINGEDVTDELKRDNTGDSYYEIASDSDITVEYTYSDIQNGTYSISKDGNRLAVQDIINGSEVNYGNAVADSRAGLWNAESVTSNGFKLINAYTGKALTYDGEKLTQSNYDGSDDQIWIVTDGAITTISGNSLSGTGVSRESDTETQTTIDSMTVSADKTTVRNGQQIKFSAATIPKRGIDSGIEWVMENGTGKAGIDENGVLTAEQKGTVTVYAKAKIGTAQSYKIEVTIDTGIEDYTKITSGYYTVFGRTSGQWEPQNPPENAFDGNAGTAYDGQSGGYYGVEFNEPQKITAFRYMPREKQESRMPGTVFEVSNDGVNYTKIYTVSSTGSHGTYYPVFADDLDEDVKQLLSENKYKYFRFSSGSSGFANIAEIEVYTDEISGAPLPTEMPDPPVEGEGIVIWADDIISEGGTHQGTGGNTDKNDFGSFTIADDKIKEFFSDAAEGETIGELTRLNAIDNWGNSAQWDGYIETTVTAPKQGNYLVYMLGNTNQSERRLELSNVTNSVSAISGGSEEYSTDNWMRLYEYTIKLEAGENTLKIQAPAGESAPNFIAMYIRGIKETGSIDGVWDTFEESFTGEANDLGIVWYKYSGDSLGGSHAIAKDGSLTITADTTDSCYGVSAVIKNVRPNTEYTITFKEKTEMAERISHGFYLNGDTLTMTSGTTVPSDENIEVASDVRNNKKIGDIHTEVVTDADWEEKSFTWTSGSGLPDGMDTYAAKFTFILRGASGTVQIKDLRITGEAAVSEPTPTAAPTAVPTTAPTAAPTAAPTTAPTATPTIAPTTEPSAYEIERYTTEIRDDGTRAVKTVTVRAENNTDLRLYAAVYNSNGTLAGLKMNDIAAAGESTVYVNMDVLADGNAKLFLWRNMEPMTAVSDVVFTEENETSRISENFNRDWLFAYGDMAGADAAEYDDSEWSHIALPHSFSIPYDLNQGSFYVGYGWYRKNFEIPSDWDDKFISLDFEGVFQVADIYINGVHVPQSKVYGYEDRTDESAPTHEGGYSGFSVDITDYVTAGAENVIAVKVDNIWQADLVPRGGDHQFSGGIYRDVTLTAVNKTHIDWYGTFVWTPALCNPAYQVSENRPDDQYKNDFERNGTGITNTLDDPNVEGEYVTEEEILENIANRTSDVEVQTEITNTSDNDISLYVKNIIKDADGNIVNEFISETVGFAPGEKKTVTARSEKIEDIKLWDFDDPDLYTALTEIYTANGTKIDDLETTFGFRSAQFKLDGFYLNGEKTLLDGANVHQDHGGWADAVTNEGFMRDVKYVKEAGFNFIRGSHYPHDPSFAEACDELGIGLWSEGGLWSIGGWNDDDTVNMKPSDWYRGSYPSQEQYREAFEQSCYDMVGSMIRINRNHPSVLVWSMGNEAFFTEDTEEINTSIKELINNLRNYAHSLDYTRKAGLGGTQRRDLNVLAVSDIAGGNGDGGTDRYTNFYIPHLVAEYSSDVNDRPGKEEFYYDQIEDPSDSAKYVLPSKTVTFADGTTGESLSAGLAIWCMYHHGSVGGVNLRKMGLMDYYRLPTTRYYMYREDRTGIQIPEGSTEGTAAAIRLEGSTDIMLDGRDNNYIYTIPNDGTGDIQLTATMVDENGIWVNDTRDMVIEVVEGNGVFPTGKSYTFKAGTTIQDGKASIEFRSYYSGETKIRAYIPDTDIESNIVTVTTENTLGIDEGTEPDGFMVAEITDTTPKLTEPETYGKTDVANNRQSRADSSAEGFVPLNAIDGDEETYWQAETPGVQNWWVFLESSYYLEKVRVYQGEAPAAYTIYYAPSGNDNEWIKVADCTGTEPEIDFGGVYASGIRVEFTGVADDGYAKLYSLNAYGTTVTGYAQNGAYISDLTPAQDIIQGWNGKTPGIDVSIEGKPITLDGTVYKKGLGLHANSEAIYDLDENYSRFTAVIGIDDEVGTYGGDGAVFKIYATVKDQTGQDTEMQIYEGIADGLGAKLVDISVEGASRLRLVTDMNTKNSQDHTDWAVPMLWGAMRDISLTDRTVETAGTVCDGELCTYVRVDGAEDDETYKASIVLFDADGTELSRTEETELVKNGKNFSVVLSDDIIPDTYAYAMVEVTDADNGIIGSGIL